MRNPVRPAVLSLLLAACAWAAPRHLVVGEIRGDPGALRGQLVRGLCGPVPCTPRARVSTAGKIDGKKLVRAQALLLTGQVTRKGGRSVTLTLEDRPGSPRGRYVFPVGKRGLSDQALATVRDALQEALGGAPTPATPLVAKPLPVVPGPKGAAEAGAGTAETAPPAPPVPGAAPAVKGPEAAAQTRPPPVPLLAVEAGLSGVNVSLGYENLTTQNLRSYDASFTLVPRVRLEGFPLAHFTQGWARGLGAEVEFQQAVGLKSAVEGGPEHPTTYRALDLILKYRWEPFAIPLRVEPLIGLRLATFEVQPVNGVFILGLPSLEYDGAQLGIGAEYPLDRWTVFARARFLPLLAAGEVLSTDYFDSGSLWGLDLEAGVGFHLVGPLSLRGAVEYTRYHFSFRPQPGDTFQATGATSRYAGGRVMIRYELP